MQPPPTHPAFSPDPNPPVKKFRAGGTPSGPAPPGGAGPPPPRGPPPPPSQGPSNAGAATFTMKVDEAMSSRRAELLKMREKIAPKPAPPGSVSTAGGGVAGSRPSTEALLNRARTQLPPPQQSSSAPNPLPAHGRPAPPLASGPPPPTMPVQDLNHFRRTSDIFPEVTSKADPSRAPPPMPAVTPGVATTTMMMPSMHSNTPAVPRNLDPSFAHNVQLGGDLGETSPPATSAPASRSKSVPPPQRRPPPAGDAPPMAPKSPGTASLDEPRRSNRPAPPGRPKAAPLEPLHPAAAGASVGSGAPPPKGPPPTHSVPRNESGPPSLAEELSPGATKPAVFLPASAPASMSIPNGVDHMDRGSSNSHASDKSQASGTRAAQDDSSMSKSDARRAAPPPPPSHRGPGNMPPPPVSPIKSNPSLPPNKGVPPARVPSLMVDTRSGPDATNPFFPADVAGPAATNQPSSPQREGRPVVPDSDVYPPSSATLFQAERYLASSGPDLDLDLGLMDGAKTPPINNKSSVELRMQSELAQLQKDKAYALRRVIELEEVLCEQKQRKDNGDGAGSDASGVLQAILHLAETQGEGAALGWVQDQLAKNGAGAASNPLLGMAPLRHPPVLPRPKRGPSAADLPPEALRSAAERVEHEYVADCATFVVRRPYGLAEERELWFKTGQMPAKKYADAASVSQVSTIEVAAVVRADESLLSVSGPHLVRHESNGQWHDFGDAPQKGEPLGFVSVVDGNTGEEIQYSLDEVYEGAVAVREQYCLSVLSSAAGIHAASKDATKDSDKTKPDAAKAEKDPDPTPASQGDAAVTFGALFSFLWSGLFSLLFNCFIVFPLRVFSVTLATLISVVLLSILWVYIADENALGQSAYWYNAPGIV